MSATADNIDPVDNGASQGPGQLNTFPPPPLTAGGADWLRGGEPVMVRMPDGTKHSGSLESFDTVGGTMSFKPKGASASTQIELSTVKAVQIVIPKKWGPPPVPPQDQDAPQQVLKPSKRPFKVHFKDGDKLAGETLGSREDHNGVYLFPLLDAEHYFCAFVPKSALANYQVGPRMGEMLVESGFANADQIQQALASQELVREKPLGETLMDRAVVTQDELQEALQRQEHNPKQVRIGDVLIEAGLITEDQLKDALDAQNANRGKPLGEMLIHLGALTRDDLQLALARKLGIPTVDLRQFIVDPDVVRKVPEDVLRKYHVLPLYTFEKRVVVATDNPLDWAPLEQVGFATGLHVDPVMSLRSEIDRVIELVFTSAMPEPADFNSLDLDMYSEPEDEEELVIDSRYSDNVVVNLVNQIIVNAYRDGASDIHIEPYQGKQKTQVRIRKDGELHKLLDVPSSLRRAIVARIKVMAGMDMTERRKPLDGRIDLKKFSKLDLELRVATLPTVGENEDVIMRILAKAEPLPVDKLGLSKSNTQNMITSLKRPHGIYLVCGPTGSGKTTTLHALLAHLNKPGIKLWTAEDPVEIVQKGLRQVQVKADIGLTFERCLRAFLRADPDIIMVGEMRDKETTSAGIEASLTGHLVLSTLHTNSAPESIVRLLDMGMDPFNFADALIGILAQRLTRRLCIDCREAAIAKEEELHALAEEYCYDFRGLPDAEEKMPDFIRAELDRWHEEFADGSGNITLYRAKGCDSCSGAGYRGRLAVHELLTASDDTKRLIQTRRPTDELRAQALSEGMRTLKQDGVEKVISGQTDIHEIRKVCVS